ncbi:putative toxin-antitoxin system toxin component, PIN family [Holophaga foetida]|uniref:putative toxin-antitoxin system toxin component, PIN family n=1 Tax=Holophaga foetida TaxID=35839 RepID=UPI00024742D5|nr:putative toxin-antitoxin system toxin component, PIN family [Holophaga foetida]
MRLVVLDTNVIVSAAIKPGSIPAKIVMDWALDGHIQVVTSPWVIGEYREVVQRAKFRRYGFPPQWMEYLVEESLHLPDPPPWPYQGQDPKDAPFLALAHASGAWLVTGNLKHFPEIARKGVIVRSPSDYLAHLVETGKP